MRARYVPERTGRATRTWSHLSMGLRYRAGGMGIPFLPSRSMMGSGIAERLPELKTIECP